MNLSGKIYSKTGKGVRALSSKSRQLSADSRKILASIDGKTDAETLMEQFQKLPDEAFITMLTQLEHDGYIKFLKNANWDIDDDDLGYANAMVVDELSPEDFFAMTNEADSEKGSQAAENQESPSPLPDDDLDFTSSKNDTSPKTDDPPKIDEEISAEAEQQAQHDVGKALELAERKQRDDAERKAAEEAERKARKAEEERQKAEEEVIAKAEQAAKQAAERIAREEEEARKKAEEETREAAEREARLEAERIAREEAERKAVEEAERKARKAEEERQRAEVEAIAKAEKLARQEAERIAKEEEARQKAEAEAISKAEKLARQEAERIAKEEAKRLADEEKALRQKAKEEARAIADEAARVKAEQAAIEKAARKAERDAERASRPPLDLSKWFKTAKTGLLYLPLVLAALVAIMHVVNLRMLASPMEKYVSEVVNEPVTIGQIRLSLLTSSLTLSEIKVASGADAGIGVIQLSPLVLLQSGKVLNLGVLELEDIVVTRASIGRQLDWIKVLSQNKERVNIEEVELKNILFSIPGLELEPFEGRITKLAGSGLGLIELESDDQRLNLKFEPINSQYKVTINAAAWKPPFDTNLEFSELYTEGMVGAQQIRFDQINAKLYSGTMTANAVLDWASEPTMTGSFELEGLSLPVTLSSMKSAASVDGTLQARGSFASTANVVGQLADNLEINATFIASNGKINEVNLASKMTSGGSRDTTTRFDRLTGNVHFNNGHYQYTQLVLTRNQFKAKGNLDIQPNQDIAGKVSGELVTPSRAIRSNLNLSGKVGNVKLN